METDSGVSVFCSPQKTRRTGMQTGADSQSAVRGIAVIAAQIDPRKQEEKRTEAAVAADSRFLDFFFFFFSQIFSSWSPAGGNEE